MSVSINSSTVAKQMMPEIGVDRLNGIDDLYGGIRVEMEDPMDPNIFSALLRASISQWRQQGKKGVWIKLPIHLSNLVDAAVKEGFKYHHAEPGNLMLVCWLPETIDNLPVNASHRVGIGAFVMNNNREVLVVQESKGVFKDSGVWKFPTGVVNEGEDICSAAIREVREETGKQIEEIMEAKWMPYEEFAAQPFMQKHNIFIMVVKVCLAKLETDYAGFSPLPTTSSSGKKGNIY